MTEFVGLFDTERDYILQLTITQTHMHTLVSTVKSSLAVSWYRLSTADVPFPLGSRTIPSLIYQLLTTTHND
jgi:hypothetical protein